MKQVIVIGTLKGRTKWANQCAISCSNPKYKVDIIENNGFELAHIMLAYHKGYDEFLYLHDTCEIKDKKLFDIVFEEQKGKSVALSDHPCIFGMYLGKYKREALKGMDFPIVTTKLEAVDYEETWTAQYISRENAHTVLLTPPLHDGQNFVTIEGRMYMKLENDYLIKYKGTWSRSML